jgi:tetratricopeptide (TPR) repeat protein
MVSAQMWELGEVVLEPPEQPGGPQRLKGWYFDPYDARWDDGAENSVTDDERLDDLLPQHPLSRVRAHLRQVRESLTLRGEPPAGDGTADATPQSDLRRFASPAVVRELLWKAERFDLIEAAITAHIPEISATHCGNELARELLMLGLVQGRQDKLLAARESLTRAHQLFSAQAGDRHPDTATAATHVARILLDLGRLLDAERFFRKALDVIETTPPNDLVLGMTLSGYGRLLLQQDRASDAMPYVLRAQELVETQKGGERCFLLRETAGGPPPALLAKMRMVP